MNSLEAIKWDNCSLILIDQTKLPLTREEFVCKTHDDVVYAIKEMIVRGAPAIGACAAYGVALGAKELLEKGNLNALEFKTQLLEICEKIYNARPTAVNLMWAVDKQRLLIENYFVDRFDEDLKDTFVRVYLFDVLLGQAHRILSEDIETNKKMAEYGNEIIPSKATILTHCNTGALATAGWGTALGVVRTAHSKGKDIFVYADETRPRLQGGKLTAYELLKEGIKSNLIVDSAAATLIRDGKIDVILVGADRIALNGDTANKIGTFMLSVIAKAYNVPFYVVAPTSTIDFQMPDGTHIHIEERDKSEITHMNGVQIIPDEIECYNPAFDVTPAENITGIITEKGILKPPFSDAISNLKTK